MQNVLPHCKHCRTTQQPTAGSRDYIANIMQAHPDLCSLGWQGAIGDARFASSRAHMASLEFAYEVQAFYGYYIHAKPSITGKTAEQLTRAAERYFVRQCRYRQPISTGAVIVSMLIDSYAVLVKHDGSCMFEATPNQQAGHKLQGEIRHVPLPH